MYSGVTASAAEEDLPSLVKRLQKDKPVFAKRQQDLLTERYDLADHPAAGVKMSRGKPVQEGVRVRLPKDLTWEKLATLTPSDIKSKDHWPTGFFSLAAPASRNGRDGIYQAAD